MTSTIEALHAAWTRANNFYTANDIASFKADERSEPRLRHSMKIWDQQTVDLGRAIMREIPTNMADAVIMLRHMTYATDLIAHSQPIANDEDAAALDVAADSLFAFLARRFDADLEGIELRGEMLFTRADVRAGQLPPQIEGEDRDNG